MITVTDSAVKQLQSILADEPDAAGKGAARGLRIFVEHGGCAGLQYGMTLDARKDGDSIVEREGVQVLVDEESAKYLSGSTIDFADGLSGAGVRIQNPNAVRSCGCGTSFEAPEAEASHQSDASHAADAHAHH
jgi:iron-sulfur cluster assembly accessory protein